MSTAVMLVIVIEIYYAATTLFDLSPFNGAKYFTPKERLTEWIINSLIFALPLLHFLIPSAWPAGVIAYGFLLVGEYMSWWHGYLKQKPARRDFYDKATRHTILVLSQDKERFQPKFGTYHSAWVDADHVHCLVGGCAALNLAFQDHYSLIHVIGE